MHPIQITGDTFEKYVFFRSYKRSQLKRFFFVLQHNYDKYTARYSEIRLGYRIKGRLSLIRI